MRAISGSGTDPTNETEVTTCAPPGVICLTSREICLFLHLLRVVYFSSQITYTDLITAFQVSALSWQPGATAAWLAVGWESGELYLYHHSSESAESSSSSTAKKCLKVDTLHAAAVFLMQWSPAGSRLVTADKNGSVVGWKVDPSTHTTSLLNYFSTIYC